MLSKFVQVYNMLEDQESKEIYLKRLNYLISGDFKYLRDIIQKYRSECLPAIDVYYADLINSLPKGRKFVLYGAGHYAKEWSCFMMDGKRLIVDDERFAGFCSRTKEKQKMGYMGFPVISPEELLERRDLSVVIFTPDAKDEILNLLRENNYPEDYIFDGSEIYKEAIKFDSEQYFSPHFMSYGAAEIFVDAGGLDLGTSLKFREYCRNIKVYAFEPDPESYQACVHVREATGFSDAILLPFGTWSEKTSLSFDSSRGGGSKLEADFPAEGNCTVPVMPIDEAIEPEDRVTMIKMDVEGAELESLKGAKNTILRDKPKLAVCIYHKPEDIWQIPLYIKELVPEYKLYIRHHSNCASETVLYAVLP